MLGLGSAATTSQAQDADATVVADTTAADPSAVSADTTTVPDDSTTVRAATLVPADPVQSWRHWKDLERAIRLRPLDGPEDILEKAAIIEDRIDDLSRVQETLLQLSQDWTSKQESLELQLEMLEDLAKVQLGGDLQLQQRLHVLRERRRMATHSTGLVSESLEDLAIELARQRARVEEYRTKAEDLRRREAESR